uniref:FRG domain-containing protein n=1 Tax=uncultured Hymenobacter sp. TaxID=170016 RepID=UPI0035CC9780
MEEKPITAIADLVEIINESGLMNEPHSHIRVWFRGHADTIWKLNPGVYRPDFKPIDENDRLSLERHLSQDFQALAAARLTGRETDAEIYFLQQHYGMPTRLMDWSSNPLIALWFAVNDENHRDKDGEIFMMDAYEIKGPGRPDDFGIASSRNPYFLKALLPIFDWQEA